ncbi:hypothetical protein [Draconibacterium halophilum]|uniref:Uncharacterized protein n=1 Tax=Draconibacterium halophilum TaxID=2706887 RepID=A0A6C0RH64_9BACT|nr:hypothetical protein [Draconibacterium halophilum]QIA09864.1 hypothetical protein G0Q07_20130 [Draconibacterium halophilum]
MAVSLFYKWVIHPEFSTYEMYEHKIETVSADPWNSWDLDWLSVISGNQSKEITITYNNFEAVPPGNTKLLSNFPANFQ